MTREEMLRIMAEVPIRPFVHVSRKPKEPTIADIWPTLDKTDKIAYLQNCDGTCEEIAQGLEDSDAGVRSVAIRHSNATVAHITKALEDTDANVRMNAIWHPNATVAHISKALEDSDAGVRDLAKKLKKSKT